MNIRMSTKGKRPLRSLTPSDKIHAIQRIHDGESKASVARDIGVPESTLRGWCKNEDKLRFMSRQSAADKLSGDPLTDRLDGSTPSLIGGPAEKRVKLDQSPMPLNFASKMKFDEMSYKRASINGLDYSTSKTLSDLSFNNLTPDYAAFNGGIKNKMFGADISRASDPSMSAISPLTSLSHLSGLAGISQSPLAISFNELTSNLNLLAQLNPGLAAMSSLNGIGSTSSTLRNVKPKGQAQIQSPRSDAGGDRQPGITVKTWAKQKPPHMPSTENEFGLNLSQSSNKNTIKCPSPSLAPSIGNTLPLPSLPEDPLLYWLKSQQAMLGLNSLYPPSSLETTSSPIRSSTPQQTNQQIESSPPIISTPSLDEKNAAWLTWCKAFGASLHSLAPVAAAAMHTTPMPQPLVSSTGETVGINEEQKPTYDNILYSHLTKDAGSYSSHSSTSNENGNGISEANINLECQGGKPQDLSAKPAIAVSAPSSPLPTIAHSPAHSPAKSVCTPSNSNVPRPKPKALDSALIRASSNVADCQDVLDNLLCKINCGQTTTIINSGESDVSDGDCIHYESSHNNNDICSNNNNNSNKTDEEERLKQEDLHNSEDLEAIRHGEKFLKWLENCSNPRVTAVHLMQLRFLIAAVKSTNDKYSIQECNSTTNYPSIEAEEGQVEETQRCKIRRRK